MNVQSIRSPIESSNSLPTRVELPSLGKIAHVQLLVANSYGVDPGSLRSRCNLQEVVIARQIAMYLCCEALGLGQSHVGRHFNRHPSTVNHAINVVSEMIRNDLYAADIQVLTEALR